MAVNENAAKAYSDLEADHGWDAIQEALENLKEYLEKHEAHASVTISAIDEVIEELPRY